jgi:hypothetical protein
MGRITGRESTEQAVIDRFNLSHQRRERLSCGHERSDARAPSADALFDEEALILAQARVPRSGKIELNREQR